MASYFQVLESLGVDVCPTCEDHDTFHSEMLFNGIFFKTQNSDLDHIELVDRSDSKEDLELTDASTEETKVNKEATPRKENANFELSVKDSGIEISPYAPDTFLAASTPEPSYENPDVNGKRKLAEDLDFVLRKRSRSSQDVANESFK